MSTVSHEHTEMLTERVLMQALEHEEASVIVCGSIAKLVAHRILWGHSPDGKPGRLFGRLKVAEDPARDPHAWELF